MATTGWLSPTNAAGTGWTTPSNVLSDDSTYSTYTVTGGAETSPLQVWGFGAAVPTGAIITGIELGIKAALTSGTIDYDYGFVNNADTFEPKGPTAFGIPDLTGTHAYVTVGGPFELYGGVDVDAGNAYDRDWSPSDINNAFFGYQVIWAGAGTISIDHLRVQIYYEMTPPMGMMMGVGR